MDLLLFFSSISFGYVCTLCFVLFIIVFLFVFAFCEKPTQYWLKMSFEKQHLGVGLLSSYYYASSSWYRGKQLQFSVIFLIVLLFAPEVRCGSTMDSNAEIPVRTTLSKVQKK